MSFGFSGHEPLDVSGESRTKQSMKDECDVNLIVARFDKTGLISHLAEGVPQFVDVSELGDYRSIIEQVRKVDEYFAGLPARVRSEFKNDASLFMDFLESGASHDELLELGLAVVGDRRADEERQRRRDDVAAAQAAEAARAAGRAPVEPVVPPEGADTVST